MFDCVLLFLPIQTHFS